MIDLDKLELFPQEIYVIEQFLSYEYYHETVLLWEDLIHYAEELLDQYSANLAADHRSQHPSHQADYVWGTIVLPNFKGTLHHLLDGLEDLKAGFLPILRRMSSIKNDLIAQGRDYPFDWMDEVEKGTTSTFKKKEDIIFLRANNIYIVSDYYDSQWDYKQILKENYFIGVKFSNPMPIYRLNPTVMVKTDEPILHTGLYRSTEPYSACKFLIKETKLSAKSNDDWKLAPEVYALTTNPDHFTTPDTIEDSQEVPTTWILVEQVTEDYDANFLSNNLKISQKNGEKCLKTGYWTTPAQPNTREYFKQGDVLPTLLDTDWGEVYWYFNGEK